MRPRVALVVSGSAEDGGAVLAARLRHLVEAGWDASLLARREASSLGGALEDPALRGRVELVRDGRRRSGPFDARLLELRPDLVHFHSGGAAWKGRGVKGRLGCRVVVSLRDDGLDLAQPDPRLLWEMADLLLFPSAAALERAAGRGWPRERASVLGSHPAALEAGVTREQRSGALRVLSAGPVVWQQGFEHSVHAVRLLLDKGVDCRYRLLGEGDHIPAVAFARRQLGLADHVELPGPVGRGRLVEEVHAADAFVDPAVTDTTSQTPLLTAIAAGVPFVATARNTPLPPDRGLTVPRRDPRAIAEALSRLAGDPGLREPVGRAAPAHGLPTLDDHVRELEGLYRRVLAGDRA